MGTLQGRYPSLCMADPLEGSPGRGAGKEGRFFIGTEAPVTGDGFNLRLDLYDPQERMVVMDVKGYGGFHKWGYPKWMVCNGKSH